MPASENSKGMRRSRTVEMLGRVGRVSLMCENGVNFRVFLSFSFSQVPVLVRQRGRLRSCSVCFLFVCLKLLLLFSWFFRQDITI